MLRVGLTGGLGSGKSTAAAIFAALGAQTLSSDAIGRELMNPASKGSVFPEIVHRFGAAVVNDQGFLDRAALARIAFAEGRVEELNAIVHPAVIARQETLIETVRASDPNAVVIVESALVFETKYGETKYGETKHGETGHGSSDKDTWRKRFDKLILVTAPEETKIARFIARSLNSRQPSEPERDALEAEALRRMALQIPDEQKAALCDFVLTNDGPVTELEWQIDRLWPLLLAASRS